jgi:hypothetical protein
MGTNFGRSRNFRNFGGRVCILGILGSRRNILVAALRRPRDSLPRYEHPLSPPPRQALIGCRNPIPGTFSAAGYPARVCPAPDPNRKRVQIGNPGGTHTEEILSARPFGRSNAPGRDHLRRALTHAGGSCNRVIERTEDSIAAIPRKTRLTMRGEDRLAKQIETLPLLAIGKDFSTSLPKSHRFPFTCAWRCRRGAPGGVPTLQG